MRRRVARLLTIAALVAFSCAAAGVAPARADFGLEEFDVTFTDSQGAGIAQAGSHPFAFVTSIAINTKEVGEQVRPDGLVKDLLLFQVPGFIGDQTAVPPCSGFEFLELERANLPSCPDSSAIGLARVTIGTGEGKGSVLSPFYNLEPSPGKAAKLGFVVRSVPVTVDIGLSESPPYNLVATSRNISQILEFFGGEFEIWGVPADPAHDPMRGSCVDDAGESTGSCPAGTARRPFLTLPRACQGPLQTAYRIDSWQNPGAYLPDGQPDLSDPNWVSGSVFTHDDAVPPNPQGMLGCGKLAFSPTITAQPTSKAASSPSGLDFSLDVNDEDLANPNDGATANSDIRKAVVTLPEGMTANPSLAEGLGVCTEAQLAKETAKSAPGAGCPDASKIGTVEVETPLLDESLGGALYIAKPYENEFGSLLALYIVIKNKNLGIVVKQAAKIEPDPVTGQLITTTDEIPQLPFSHFRLHFREGGRSPLISPPGCDADPSTPALDPYTVKAELTPWSGGAPLTTTSAFQIITGPNEAPCPPGGVAPFHPGFEAGSLNNDAKAYSPFYMRLTRKDGEQDMTKFSAVLPPGVVGKIAGVSKCSEVDIAQAKARTGPHGAQEELDSPSCPASSKIGRTLAGAGVGSQLTYVPGSLYLAGPVAGDPLSVVAITPGKAGPFDVGNIVVREALTLNPVTTEVEVDGSHSDPIPHILKGIPLNVRDLRVYADKPEFTINPTDCEESSARATLFGGFLDVFSPADDVPVGLSSRYQAANCASLGFKPKLQIKLKGGTKRGGHPALKAVVTPRPEDANFAAAVVTLPHSAFLDQAHIRTICTRVQFEANGGNGAGCPEGAVYGQATATSPLLDEALSGPVYLRSSSHNLPDLVVALHGLVNINLASRIDSFKGGIRSTFEAIPDAPVSRFVLEMQGGKKGLIVNSTNLCASTNRAKARLSGQNGKVDDFKPLVRVKCRGKGGRHKRLCTARRRARVAHSGRAATARPAVRAVGCGGKRHRKT